MRRGKPRMGVDAEEGVLRPVLHGVRSREAAELGTIHSSRRVSRTEVAVGVDACHRASPWRPIRSPSTLSPPGAVE